MPVAGVIVARGFSVVRCRVTMPGVESQEARLAAVMREVLDQARWDPDGDPEEVLATLRRLSDGITDVVVQDGAVNMDYARIVFDFEPLGDLYVFAAAVRKTVDQQHPAQRFAGRNVSRPEFIRQAAGSFASFHQQQRELSEALDRVFPRS